MNYGQIDTQILAMQTFRAEMGVHADPERHPQLWALHLEDAAAEILSEQVPDPQDYGDHFRNGSNLGGA